MAKSYHDLNPVEQKLQKISIITTALQYGPIFGYSLNKEMYYIWLLLAFIGSISMLFKLRWIRPELRTKISIYEMLVTIALIVWIFSEDINVPMIIKQLVFFIVTAVAGYRYFKLLYDGKLAIKDTNPK